MVDPSDQKRVVVMGAAGRDFHNFNVMFRHERLVRVVAFTATQIPGIADRRYPPALAGPLYPDGIPIEDEADLERLCARHDVSEVLFAYSDVPHGSVMHAASRVLATGCTFPLAGPKATMLHSVRPVIAVSAVRTGCGKSQTARHLSRHLRERGYTVAVIRHPMPYGDLPRQKSQRFASLDDLDAADCTIEEREEYEPHIASGSVVFAGVDYGDVLASAEEEAEIILWDGGNNDFPFFKPDLHIVLTDALRPTQLTTHHPGETVLRLADIVVVNKVRAAAADKVMEMVREIHRLRPGVPVVRAASPVRLDDPEAVEGRRVLVVEDGPTITHGGMGYGAGYVAVAEVEGATLVDPRRFATPEIAPIFEKFPHIGRVLPALGYGEDQRRALAATIAASDAEVVVAATPVDLARILDIGIPVVRARYDYEDTDEPRLAGLVDDFLRKIEAPHRPIRRDT
jgi:predicted GTPase